VGYVLTEPRIRMLEAVCRHGSVVYSGRFGKTARILEDMRFVTVDYSVVWVPQKRRYSVVMSPRCRWTVRPTKLGFAVVQCLTMPDPLLHCQQQDLNKRISTRPASMPGPVFLPELSS
jgi:hypothetical protein